MAQRITPAYSSPRGVERDMTPITADPEAGNVVINLPSLQFVVDNAEGEAAVSVVFTTTATVRGYAVADLTVSIPAGETRVFGDFPQHVFGTELNFRADAAVPIKHVYA